MREVRNGGQRDCYILGQYFGREKGKEEPDHVEGGGAVEHDTANPPQALATRRKARVHRTWSVTAPISRDRGSQEYDSANREDGHLMFGQEHELRNSGNKSSEHSARPKAHK